MVRRGLGSVCPLRVSANRASGRLHGRRQPRLSRRASSQSEARRHRRMGVARQFDVRRSSADPDYAVSRLPTSLAGPTVPLAVRHVSDRTEDHPRVIRPCSARGAFRIVASVKAAPLAGRPRVRSPCGRSDVHVRVSDPELHHARAVRVVASGVHVVVAFAAGRTVAAKLVLERGVLGTGRGRLFHLCVFRAGAGSARCSPIWSDDGSGAFRYQAAPFMDRRNSGRQLGLCAWPLPGGAGVGRPRGILVLAHGATIDAGRFRFQSDALGTRRTRVEDDDGGKCGECMAARHDVRRLDAGAMVVAQSWIACGGPLRNLDRR